MQTNLKQMGHEEKDWSLEELWATLEGEIRDYFDKDAYNFCKAELLRRLSEKDKRIAELRKYAYHRPDCSHFYGSIKSGWHCDCGFDALSPTDKE